jgi:hypothetical protein
MPKAPKAPDHRIDPAHDGDGRAIHSPTSRDGHPVTEKPLQDAHGRTIAPDRDRVGRIDQKDFHDNIHGIQDHWDVHDHGYGWHNWNGWNVCHHYDEFGFHWWGFYFNNAYFWARYYNDGYWWFDPYWHRWVFLRDGRWWWTGPGGLIYLYTDGGYYQYDNGDGGVIMTPDPAPPVDVPPGDQTPVNQTSVYSLDGTRSVQITGADKDAYLYDLTVADPASSAAQGKWLASGVTAASFVANADGSIAKIVLTATDGSGAAASLTFDKDGTSLDGGSNGSADGSNNAPAEMGKIQALQQKMQGSATFQTLKTGFSW